MGYRLTKIYTRTGDKGTTGLGDGNRVDKDHPRIEAIGAVDELNSFMGLLLAHELPDDVRADLTAVQHRLFDLGGELSMPGYQMLRDEHVEFLEQRLDALNANLPALKDFILPGGTREAALCHVARTVCRRAERCLVCLSREDQGSETALKFLNRLSDLLFVTARALNRRVGQPEPLWQKSAP